MQFPIIMFTTIIFFVIMIFLSIPILFMAFTIGSILSEYIEAKLRRHLKNKLHKKNPN